MNGCLIDMQNICKSFPGVKALDHVSFDVRPGEVHALLGENGAGKSTLMKILAGIYERDEGTFLVNGAPVGSLTPRQAQELGIAIIHQELNMCQHLTVAENMFLGREKVKWLNIQQKALNKEAAKVLARLKLDIRPDTVVGRLPVSKQQMVEIAKALSTNCKVLVMDEPTSALTAREVEELNRIILELKAQGCGIVYISHRLEELAPIADRVTVLRDGKYVDTKNFADTSVSEIIAMMVGREIKEKFPHVSCNKGEKLMEVRHLTAGHAVQNVSFSLYKGEILGFAGLLGAGRTELIRAIFGADKIDKGEILLDGKVVHIATPRDAIAAGIVCVPEDRKKEGLCVELSLRENVGLANLDRIKGPLTTVRIRKEAELTKRAISELKIKTPTQLQQAKNLSGGNQQKVVVGKWLVRDAGVYLFDEPTRGIDVAAKVEIYHLMNRLKEAGYGVLFISSEMPEVLGMADRILVMCDGRITGEMMAKDATQAEIMRYATQFKAKGGNGQYAV